MKYEEFRWHSRHISACPWHLRLPPFDLEKRRTRKKKKLTLALEPKPISSLETPLLLLVRLEPPSSPLTMSVLNPNSEEEPQECPLCLEYLELDDINFYPCSCGYQVRSRDRPGTSPQNWL